MSKIAIVEGTQARTLEVLAADLLRADDIATAIASTTIPALLHDRSRILQVNTGLVRWLGYQHRDQLVGAPLSELSEADDRASLYAALGAGTVEPPARSHIQRFSSANAESSIGNVLSRRATLNDSDVVLSLCEPTSSTQRSGTLLRLLEEAVDHLHDIVFITEAEAIDGVGRRIVFVNRIYSLVTGYEPGDVLGKTPNITIGGETNPDTLKRIEKNLKARQPVHEELLKYKKYGEEYWVELDILPVFDESGQHTHWVSVQRDISERRRLESQLVESERLASSGLLAAKVANEINQPLAAATSSLKLLSERLPELLSRVPNSPEIPTILEALRDARTATQRVASSATYLKLLAATGRGASLPTDVNEVMDRAIQWLDTSLAEPVQVQRRYGELSHLLADPDRLVHLFHLVLQGVARGKRDEPRTLLVHTFSHHAHVQISVRSQRQAEGRSSNPPEPRRGLGLFVANYLVRELGGYLEMSSGDAVDILLPMQT